MRLSFKESGGASTKMSIEVWREKKGLVDYISFFGLEIGE